MDVATLLEPRSDEAPSGENLEYDPAFTELELAAQPGEEHQMGDEVKSADGPNFREVKEKALEIMQRSHDLRAAVFMAQAELALTGLSEFADVTSYIRGCLEQYWETCHPQLDEDDGDPMMRVNAVRDLCGDPGGMGGPSAIYSALRRVSLTDSRTFGRISLRDIQIAEGDLTAGEEDENVPDSGSVTAAFKDTDDDVLEANSQAANRAIEDLEGITEAFDQHVPGQGPDLSPLIKQLRLIVSKTSNYGGVGEVAEDTASDDDDAPDAAKPSGGGASVGGINSPNDVINALDRIMDYYKRSEPSSPLPILLDRAKRLVNADFVTIIKDMAPSGVENVNLIGGLEDEESY